ncbi:hypothetical protein ACFQV2_21535 [Actinokineospora soli]|uniref:Phosphodiesterase n=1 Tax=Actinokineospora soli TaxID=1048753 RepID=A0ABW2TT83_9PSEU
MGVNLIGRWSTCPGSPLEGVFPDAADVLVRMSKGAGTPGAWPDVLGLAVRVPAEPPVDLLLSTVGPFRVPWPRKGWGRGRYDAILPYRLRGRLVWISARVEGDVESSHVALREHARRGFRVLIAVSGWFGAPKPAALLAMQPSAEEVDWFDPMRHHHPDLRPVPRLVTAIRERAYAASRRGREAG